MSQAYINAETTAGGFPGWVTTLKGRLRSNDSDYVAAWTPYIQEICKIVKPYQISEGGPVILVQVENELTETNITDPYFKQIEKVIIDSGIVVPTTFNDWGRDYSFSYPTNTPDIYGFDSYPQSFDCSRPEIWDAVVDTYWSYHLNATPSIPLYIPEFQGGAFDPWGPAAPGYPKCRTLTGSDFESVFYKGLWASNVKMVSFYMLYGGTNWGHLAFPGVYTSYDYGASIAESRELTDKYAELKRQSLFLRSVQDFYNTEVVENISTNTSSDSSYIVELKNPSTGAGFIVVRQLNSTAIANVTIPLSIETSGGQVNVSTTLQGRESKVVVTDLQVGNSTFLKYTTASILYTGAIGTRDVLFLYGRLRDTVTASFTTFDTGFVSTGPASFDQIASETANEATFKITTSISGLSALSIGDSLLVLFADTDTAGTFWNPLITSDQNFANFYSFGTNETVLVGGAYLVRNASITDSTIAIRGDLNATSGETTTLIVLAPSTVASLTWNGDSVTLVNTSLSSFGLLIGTVTPPTASISLPPLVDWSFQNSLPEVLPGYDDTNWTQIKTGKLNNPYPMFYGDLELYACEYGFCEGATVWRGAFEIGEEVPTAVNLSLSAFAGSVWLNDNFLGTSFGNSTNNLNIIATTNQSFGFPAGSLTNGTNIVTVLLGGKICTLWLNVYQLLTDLYFTDNMGQDEGQNGNQEAPKHPRGIQGYSLVGGGNFTYWKVQGKIGGNVNFPDKTRGITNEGGFYAEREGWHLPGVNTTSWEKRSPTKGLSEAGVGFFTTTVKLNIPSGLDVSLNIVYDGLDTSGSNSTAYRSQLYINGWNFARFVSNLGPQTIFPIPEGILDYQGENTISLILWAMGNEGASINGLNLTLDGIYSGGVGSIGSDNPSWSSRESL
ncbi:hypothetical protein P7C70_g5971, partial [Phenoliferia sp. Uapishka_3]